MEMNKNKRESNIKRAQEITTEWPSWKSDYQLTKYSSPSSSNESPRVEANNPSKSKK